MAGNSSTLTDSVLGAVGEGACLDAHGVRLVGEDGRGAVGAARPPFGHRHREHAAGRRERHERLVVGDVAGRVGLGSRRRDGALLSAPDPDGAVPLVPHPTSTAAVANTAAATANVRVGFLMTSAPGAVHRCRASAPRARRGGPLRCGCRGSTSPAPNVVTGGSSPVTRRPAARRVGPTGRAGQRTRWCRWSRTPRPGSPPR